MNNTSMFRYTIKALLLSRSYQSFGEIIEAFTGINSLRIWKRPKAFVQSEFEGFVPETPYVSNILADLGLKSNQIRGRP